MGGRDGDHQRRHYGPLEPGPAAPAGCRKERLADREDPQDGQEGHDRDQRRDEGLVEEAEPEPGQTLAELDGDPAQAER